MTLVGTPGHPRHRRRSRRHVHPGEAEGQRRQGDVVVHVQVAGFLRVHLDLESRVLVLIPRDNNSNSVRVPLRGKRQGDGVWATQGVKTIAER